MSRLISNVSIVDNRGQSATATAVLTEDSKFAVASLVRIYVGEYKESSTGSGNETRPVGFGDIHLFRADNVVKGKDGYTAELTHIQGPLGIRFNEIRKPTGEVNLSINSYLNDKISMSKDAKTFRDVTNSQIQEAILESINVASEELNSKKSVATQPKLARASAAFMGMVESADKKKKPAVKQQPADASAGAVTAADVLPD
jgi:hypothetical protein